MTSRIVAALDEFTLGMLAGDNGTMQIVLATLAADRRFARLRDPEVFEAVLRTMPASASWLDALEPITPMFEMTAPNNVMRRFVVDDRPIVTGLHCVGDAACTTNPTFGRGISIAMWNSVDLADVVDEHGDDHEGRAFALDRCVDEHVAPYFDDQVAVDAARLVQLRHTILGDPAPPAPGPDPQRTNLAELRLASCYDPDAFRVFNRVLFMLSPPAETYRDPQVVACVKRVIEARVAAGDTPRVHLNPGVTSPTREAVAAALGLDRDRSVS